MATTMQQQGKATGLVGEDEAIEAIVEAQTGLPAFVIMFGPLGKLAFLALQRHRVIIATNRQVRVFESSVFATKLPIKEVSHASRDNTPVRVETGKMGRSKLDILGESLWMGKNQDHQAGILARKSKASLEMPEPEGQQAIRERVLEDNRAVVRKRRLMALGALLVVFALIGYLISVSTRDNSFSVAHKTGEQYCGGDHYGEYSAYTTDTANVLVIGDRPLQYDGMPGVVPQSSNQSARSFRFDQIVNHKGKLDADIVVCVQNAGRTGSDCATGKSVQGFDGKAFDVESSQQLDAWTAVSPADCWDGDQPFHVMLCETAGCPVDRSPS